MNFNFLFGFATALIVGTPKGREVFKDLSKGTGNVADKILNFTVETAKEAMPTLTKTVQNLTKKEDVLSNDNEHSNT